jgi:signal transduction histidine kinase
MMPKMNGYEVCRQLKGNPQTAPIPVLLMTGLREREDRLKGIEAGANDFLSKPIDIRDAVLRVRNAIYTKHLFDQLAKNYGRLRESEALRNSLMAMIIHDLIGPLRGMKVSLQLLQHRIHDKLAEDEAHNLSGAVNLLDYLATMIHSLLDISRLGAGELSLKFSRGDLRKAAKTAIAKLVLAKERERVVLRGLAGAVWASMDAEVIGRVILHLLENALRFSPKGEIIEVRVEKSKGQTWIGVSDKGPGISPEFQEKLLGKNIEGETSLDRHKHSTGLGLTFCKLAVEAHGGNLIIDSKIGKGTTVRFWLPAIPKKVSSRATRERAAGKKRGSK